MKSFVFLSGNGCSKASKVGRKPCCGKENYYDSCFQPWGKNVLGISLWLAGMPLKFFSYVPILRFLTG